MRLLLSLCLAFSGAAQNTAVTANGPRGVVFIRATVETAQSAGGVALPVRIPLATDETVLRRNDAGSYPIDGFATAVYRNGLRQARGVDFRQDGAVLVPLTGWQPDDLVLADVAAGPKRDGSATVGDQLPPAAPVSVPTVVQGSTAPDPNRPGQAIGANMRECQAGDRSPDGTIVDGYRKVRTPTPFGLHCRWEKVR